VAGKTWTGFANTEEAFAEQWAGTKILPFWIETEAKAMTDTNFITNSAFKPFAIRDGDLITGQQQFSGAAAARLVIRALSQQSILRAALIGQVFGVDDDPCARTDMGRHHDAQAVGTDRGFVRR
jgi:hypothetical protein